MADLECCSVCVMNSTVSGIFFDENGQCNYCKKFINKIEFTKRKKFNLEKLISKIIIVNMIVLLVYLEE